MTSATHNTEGLKIDARGRVRTPAARQEELLDEFERSGISGIQFARLSGVKYATFAVWRQRRARQRAEGSKGNEEAGAAGAPRPLQAVRFFEAFVDGGGAPAGLRVELLGGATLRVDGSGQVALAAELLRSLARGEARREKEARPC